MKVALVKENLCKEASKTTLVSEKLLNAAKFRRAMRPVGSPKKVGGALSKTPTRALPELGAGGTAEDFLVLRPGASLEPPEFLMLTWPGLGEIFSVVVVSGAAPGVGVTSRGL